jgi:subfamily B ATP-binding cassette protein MsbA
MFCASAMHYSHPFWTTATDLLQRKWLLALALFGALVSAVSFGAGLGMMLPVFYLLLQPQDGTPGLPGLINAYLVQSDFQIVRHLGQWLLTWAPVDPFRGFVLVMVGIVALSLVGGLGRYVHSISIFIVVRRTTSQRRMRLFRQMINAPLVQALQSNVGDQISRISSDTQMLGSGHQAIFDTALLKLLNAVVALICAFWLNWRLALIGLVGVPAIALLLRALGKRIGKASGRATVRRGEMTSTLREALQNIRVVKAHSAEAYERRRFHRLSRLLERDELGIHKMYALAKPMVEAITMTAVAIVASFAAFYVLRRGVGIEQFMTVLAMLAAAGAATQRLLGLHNRVYESTPAAKRILEALAMPTETNRLPADAPPPRLGRHRDALTLQRVSFTYPGQSEQAVGDVSLHVPHGATVALVGTNGSGKTTLVSLLPRHFEPTTGRVLVDGIDIAGVGLRSLRDQIGIVTQQTVLFRGSVAHNIAYGRPHMPMQKIVAAARAADADEFIQRLAHGYETELGDDGSGLSGGEKQRLCIARAILRDPAILILDEATSQIDADSELRINQLLRALRQGRTTFVIAHRLSTVIEADTIFVMDQGRLIDQGTHEQLLHRCDTYRLLAQAQMQMQAASV